jgi:hemerythrin superfamily protein
MRQTIRPQRVIENSPLKNSLLVAALTHVPNADAAKRRGTAFAHSNRKFMEVPMDALELLKQDHQKVKELFKQGQQTEDRKQQKQIFKEIKAELETHARIEETIFYPAMQEHDELKDMVLESLEEHKQLKTVLRELGKLAASSERFKPKFKVLMDDVKHHAEEEEEGKMFPKIRNLVKGDELRQLGEELEAAKHKRLRKAS